MKSLMFGMCLMVGLSVSVYAVPICEPVTVDYGWENGGTILGSYGNVSNPMNVAGGMDINGNPVVPHSGSAMLQVSESPLSSTPQTFLSVVTDIADGAEVTASFFGYDVTPGAAPSMRIWGSYISDVNDINSYAGSAGGNNDYTPGDGWGQVSHAWTVDFSSDPSRVGLVIQARLYSPSDAGDSVDYFIDDLSVTAPCGATIQVAPEPSTLALIGLGALAMFWRKRR